MSYQWAADSRIDRAILHRNFNLNLFKKHPKVIEGPAWSQFSASPKEMFELGVKAGRSRDHLIAFQAKSRFYMVKARDHDELLEVAFSCFKKNIWSVPLCLIDMMQIRSQNYTWWGEGRFNSLKIEGAE